MMTEPLRLAATPLVTAIVSTYNAERFMQGCLDDLVAQTLFPRMEVIIIDSGSPQNEAAICAPFVQQYPNVHYLRTEREGIYAAWNRGVQMAKGKYLTNANTDDRHSPVAFETLAALLEQQPNAPLAYAHQYASRIENEDFTACDERGAPVIRWSTHQFDDLILRCSTGSQPMWRKSLHDKHGPFNADLTIVGDWDFWLRIAQEGAFINADQVLGVLYESENTLSGASNLDRMELQNLAVRKFHLAESPCNRLKQLNKKVARELMGVGYSYAKKNDTTRARQFFLEAWKLDPWSYSLTRTLLLRGVLNLKFSI